VLPILKMVPSAKVKGEDGFMGSLSLSQVLNYDRSLPVGRSHVFEDEFSVEEINFGMKA
jgi:hypothetical protein